MSVYFLYFFSQTVELEVVYDIFTFNCTLFNQSSLVEVSKKKNKKYVAWFKNDKEFRNLSNNL